MQYSNYQHFVTLSGNPEPVFVTRPTEMLPFSELPPMQQEAVIRHKARFSVETIPLLALAGMLISAFLYMLNGKQNGELLVRFLGWGAICGAFAYIPWFLFTRCLRPNTFQYVWFYGKVDDCILCTNMCRFFATLLSINGMEFPASPNLVGHMGERKLSGDVTLEILGGDWLLGTDVFVLQKKDSVGENYPALMVFPEMNNRVVEYIVKTIE